MTEFCVEQVKEAKTLFDKYEQYFEENEAENNLIISLFRELDVKYFEYFIIVVKRKEEFSSIYLMTPPHNLILYFKKESEKEKEEKYNLLIDFLFEKEINFPGVFGEATDVELFYKLLNKKKEVQFDILITEGVYKLLRKDLIVTEKKENLQISICEDAEEVLDIITEFQRTVNPFDVIDKETVRKNAQFFIDLKSMYLLKNEKKEIVSICGLQGKTLNGMRVSMVFTPKEFRKNGFASILVSNVCDEFLEKNKEFKFIFLFTDLNYSTPNKVYKSIGFQQVSKFLMTRNKQ